MKCHPVQKYTCPLVSWFCHMQCARCQYVITSARLAWNIIVMVRKSGNQINCAHVQFQGYAILEEGCKF